MGDPRFPILGAAIPPIVGRTAIMQRLWTDLTKGTPSNLSIIGPRFVGKTVVMSALANKAGAQDSPYEFVLHWHLGHVSPTSDDEFIAELCNLLRSRLVAAGGNYREHQEYLNNHSFEFLKEVTDSLDSDGKAILMLWDGFDKPLGRGKLTGHLWDQMRTIFYGKKHKVVTATRRTLRELIRSQDADTSHFWNIFDVNPVRIGGFDEQDRESIIRGLPQHAFIQGAMTELFNWSAGLPPLFLELLNQVLAEIPSGQVDNQDINQAAVKATQNLSGLISTMWEDCPAPAKELFINLVDHGSALLSNVSKTERDCLVEKCFARQSGNKLIASCRMLQQHVNWAKPEVASIARLFETWEQYKSNIRSLLEHRLAQIKRFDERLHRLMARAIEDIPDFPDDCLNNLTSIEECALDLIWQREFGKDKVLPNEIVEYWENVSPKDENGQPKEKTIQRLKARLVKGVPGDRGLQCGMLQLLTGSKMDFESRAKCTSKDTYVLINAIHSFRNRNQHNEGQSMHLGVAVAAIMTCLELLACLECELKN